MSSRKPKYEVVETPTVRKQLIVLEVTYSEGDDDVADPSDWNWSELTGEKVVLRAAGPVSVEYDQGG